MCVIATKTLLYTLHLNQNDSQTRKTNKTKSKKQSYVISVELQLTCKEFGKSEENETRPNI